MFHRLSSLRADANLIIDAKAAISRFDDRRPFEQRSKTRQDPMTGGARSMLLHEYDDMIGKSSD
jgi:hypothetical protein